MITTPLFLDTAGGRCFAVHHRPENAADTRGQVLCVLPFNEEMNRCRSMVTLQARALAEQGFGTLVVDLLGTGDSEGEHGQARWSAWLHNLRDASRWLDAQPGPRRVIWGIRLGAILAAQLHAERNDANTALLLWQAVADGKTHLTQFLRVRIAANMDRPELPKETNATMRAQWQAGQSVEVAGYEIHPDLAAAIDEAKLTAHSLPAGTSVLWLENAVGDPPGPTPASQALLQRWPGPACRGELQVFDGPAFWQVHERVLAPQAIDRSMQWLKAWAAA
ncbi:hydrolase, exosortase system type 1 associated [Burkholderiales bacterium JOSHI_001]|nr:hydrolase, exosortase system type 1 associated [Burkholderiales bacterium JOSHI_001]